MPAHSPASVLTTRSGKGQLPRSRDVTSLELFPAICDEVRKTTRSGSNRQAKFSLLGTGPRRASSLGVEPGCWAWMKKRDGIWE